MTTVLQLVQDVTDSMALPTPTALIGATDKSVKQYRAILLKTILELSEYRWQQQTIRRTFTTVATQDQGALDSATVFGVDYMSLVTDSVWNETRHMRVFGPMSEQVWEALQTLPNAGPEFQYWLTRGHMIISPTPVAGETIGAIITTKYNVLAMDGITYKERVTVDSDSLVFPDTVVKACFEYKWRQQKGAPGWQDFYNDYMALLAKNVVKDSATRLSMDRLPNVGARPGIVIPPGSWNV